MDRSSTPPSPGIVANRSARRRSAGWFSAAPRLSGFAATLGVLVLAGGSTGAANQGQANLGVRVRAIAHRAGGDFSDRALLAAFRDMDPAALALARRLTTPSVPEARLTAVSFGDVRAVDSAASLPADALQTLSWDAARIVNAGVPFSEAPNPPAARFILPASGEDRQQALNCLTQAVYYEAAYEPAEGQAAVAQVVLNRLRHPLYPKTVCGVVYQGSGLPTGCQFTFTCDGSLGRPPVEWAWKQARYVAERALNGYVEKAVGYATHYHADYVVPYWMPSLYKVAKIGTHIFYRWPAGLGAPSMFNGRYAGGERLPRFTDGAEVQLASFPTDPVDTGPVETLAAPTQVARVVQEPVVVAALEAPKSAAETSLEPVSVPKVDFEAPRTAPRIAVPTGW